MRIHHITIAIGLYLSIGSKAQVICVYCSDQSAPLTTGVTNLLLNGGFESSPCPPAGGVIGDPTSFCPNSLGYVCDLDNWTCTGGGTDTYACVSDASYTTVVEGDIAVYFGNHYCDGCLISGDTLCVVEEDCIVTGIPPGYPVNEPEYGGTTGVSLEQTVSGLVVGETYVLEFWAGGEFLGQVYSGIFAVDVGFGNFFLRCWPTDGGSTHPGTRYAVYFIANATSHTVRFTNWGHISSFATELILDDVKLYDGSQGPVQGPCTVGLEEPSVSEGIEVVQDAAAGGWIVQARRDDPKQMTLYDVTGRVLLRQQFNRTMTILAEDLAPGVCLYVAEDLGGGRWSGRLVNEQ